MHHPRRTRDAINSCGTSFARGGKGGRLRGDARPLSPLKNHRNLRSGPAGRETQQLTPKNCT